MQGIDISNHQAGINLSAVLADFVVVMVSEGTGWAQPHWRAQADQALAAGRRLGLYHWAHGNGNAMAAEARWFASCVTPYKGRAVMCLDWEDSRALPYGPTGAKEWLDAARSLLGTAPLVYLNGNGIRSGDWTQVARAGYPLWYAGGTVYDVRMNGYNPPTYPSSVAYWGRPAVFQYTQYGRLPGWSGDLDLNTASWDTATWDAHAKGQAATAGTTPFGDVRATHVLFEHQGRVYCAALADGTYHHVPSPAAVDSLVTVLTRTGWKPAWWRDYTASASNVVANTAAFGREVTG